MFADSPPEGTSASTDASPPTPTFRPGEPESVHFSWRSRRVARTQDHTHRVLVLGGGTAVVLLVCCCWWIVGGLNVLFIALLGLLPLLAYIGVAAGPSLHRLRWRARYAGRIDHKPDPTRRICCVGVPEELAGLGGLRDVPFEPRIFKASLAVPPASWLFVLIIALSALAGASAAGLAYLLVGFRAPPLLIVWSSYATVYAVYAWFRPIYYRVVPGRLDEMRFPVFRRTPPRVQHYDLKASKLLVDLRRHVLFIDGPAGSTELSFALIWGRQRFAHAVLLGALSTYPAGPVTDTELVG